jgi:hypothetical protein
MVVRVTMKDGRLSNAPGARTVTIIEEDYARLREIELLGVAEEAQATAQRIHPPMLPFIPRWLLYWLPFVLFAFVAVVLVGWVLFDYAERAERCERQWNGHGVLVRRSGVRGGTVCVEARGD